MENIRMTPEQEQKVADYVYAKYKQFEKKTLIIKEKSTHYEVLAHKDGSPLILGKDILNK
jgi:hypothetical protein